MILAVSLTAVWDGVRRTVTCIPCASNGAPVAADPLPEVIADEPVASLLTRLIGDRTMLLTRRRIVEARRVIDVIAVATSGVWLIVEDHHRAKIIHDLHWMESAAAAVVERTVSVPDIPVVTALCDDDADPDADPLRVNGVWLLGRRHLASVIDVPGPLSPEDVLVVGMQLAAAALPEAR